MADDDNDLNEDMLDSSESTDSDELGERAGDDGYDAPDSWSAGERTGNTEREEREGETLDEKLAEERPDTPVEDQPDRPVGATPVEDLDDSIDERVPESPEDLAESDLVDAAGDGAVVRDEQPTAEQDVRPA